ncbi:metallophosphoesterase [Ramlibacter rhizophilus]|uniref:Metallophosphoesterase n=1 Tax=Ramlibacter rhizophilus TaxID=1781167 RepID=A0A4Z0BHT1_9BURK|nr:metallophosphoesterase [Ramlibacter rhizophilus]TFY98023.1 metallophosphoesterase [Ramlibacter rhizophilus]
MKVQLLSDLHLESHPGCAPRPAPEAELLVLAGDIGSYQPGSRLEGSDFGLDRFSPLRGWPTPVLYVPGNHEYDGLDFDATHARLRETCERLGIRWLERECALIEGVRFLGTTLWTDFEAIAREAPDTVRRLKARDKAMRAANFYLRRNTSLRDGQPLLADGWRELGLACHQWLRDALAQPFDGPTVVVTHFAPSLRSADPRYGLTPGTAGFCNGLDALFDQADYWLHGHLHCQQDYVAGGCRVLANTLGYASKGEQEGFREQFVIEIKPRRARTRPADGLAVLASPHSFGGEPS